jgi:phosphatidylglycerol:prolipoprotein diacylglycerol transferase
MLSYFELFGQKVHLYNIFLCLGLIAGALDLEKRIVEKKMTHGDSAKIRFIAAVTIPMSLFFAYFFDLIVTRGQKITFDLRLTEAGLTFLGGLLGSFFTLFVLSFFTRISFILLLNLAVAPIALGHAFGRIGCFFAGCCFGSPTSCFWGVQFPKGSLPYETLGNVTLHPTQLYEALGLFVIYILVRKTNFSFRFVTYLLSYGCLRFFIEFFRADERGNFSFIDLGSPSQVISILFVVFAALFILIKKR